MNQHDRNTVHRWVAIERRPEAEVQHLITTTFDGEDRPALREYLNDLRATQSPGESAASKTRPRLVSDWPVLYREIVGHLRQAGLRLTWENVATEARLRRRELDSLSPSTIREWCDQDGLPHPSKL